MTNLRISHPETAAHEQPLLHRQSQQDMRGYTNGSMPPHGYPVQQHGYPVQPHQMQQMGMMDTSSGLYGSGALPQPRMTDPVHRHAQIPGPASFIQPQASLRQQQPLAQRGGPSAYTPLGAILEPQWQGGLSYLPGSGMRPGSVASSTTGETRDGAESDVYSLSSMGQTQSLSGTATPDSEDTSLSSQGGFLELGGGASLEAAVSSRLGGPPPGGAQQYRVHPSAAGVRGTMQQPVAMRAQQQHATSLLLDPCLDFSYQPSYGQGAGVGTPSGPGPHVNIGAAPGHIHVPAAAHHSHGAGVPPAGYGKSYEKRNAAGHHMTLALQRRQQQLLHEQQSLLRDQQKLSLQPSYPPYNPEQSTYAPAPAPGPGPALLDIAGIHSIESSYGLPDAPSMSPKSLRFKQQLQQPPLPVSGMHSPLSSARNSNDLGLGLGGQSNLASDMAESVLAGLCLSPMPTPPGSHNGSPRNSLTGSVNSGGGGSSGGSGIKEGGSGSRLLVGAGGRLRTSSADSSSSSRGGGSQGGTPRNSLTGSLGTSTQFSDEAE